MMQEPDQIFIRGQRVRCHVGVPDEELAQPQLLVIHTALHPLASGGSLSDDIARTVDYHAVSILIRETATAKPRRLIETLAEDLAAAVLAGFPVSKVSITIEKFILPDTDCVGVSITREAQ